MKLKQIKAVSFCLFVLVLIVIIFNVYSKMGVKRFKILNHMKRVSTLILNSTTLRQSSERPTAEKGIRPGLIGKHSQRPIPKIIHQIWNDDIVPTAFVENVRGLVRDNPSPEWKYYFWTKDSGLKMVQKYFPYLYKTMADATHLMRADVLRYLVIYQYGGVYFDLDTVSVKPLNDFVNSHHCSVALEPAEHFFHARTDFLLTNNAMFCVRRHPFYTHLILHLTTTLHGKCVPFSCTGPAMLSSVYRELNKTDNFDGELPDVQPSELFQDKYDSPNQAKILQDICYNRIKLKPHQAQSCDNWIARGKDKRKLSDKAITYHTWSHIDSKKMQISEANHIKKIVPHAMIYEKDF